MYISKESKAYLDKVVGNDQLTAIDTCTAVMQGVMEFLGTGATTVLTDFNPSLDGIYSLTLNFGGDIRTPEHKLGGWEHGIALQKIGDDLVLYQGWVGAFTLSDWLTAAANVSGYPSVSYSPLHAKCSREGMKTWLNMLRSLASSATGDALPFKATVEFLFGPATTPVGDIQLGDATRSRSKLQYHWKHRALKPIDQVGT